MVETISDVESHAPSSAQRRDTAFGRGGRGAGEEYTGASSKEGDEMIWGRRGLRWRSWTCVVVMCLLRWIRQLKIEARLLSRIMGRRIAWEANH